MIKRGQQTIKKKQGGTSAVEFGLIAIVFFTLLLGIIEFGRLLYLWNTVQEVTRMAARQAVVSDFTSAEIDRVQRTAIFQGGSTGTVHLPGGGEVSNLQVNIQYLDGDGNVVGTMPSDPADNIAACLDSDRYSSCIRYVEARICQRSGNDCDPVRYAPMIGLFTFLAINIPTSPVVMPAESLGYRPD